MEWWWLQLMRRCLLHRQMTSGCKSLFILLRVLVSWQTDRSVLSDSDGLYHFSNSWVLKWVPSCISSSGSQPLLMRRFLMSIYSRLIPSFLSSVTFLHLFRCLLSFTKRSISFTPLVLGEVSVPWSWPRRLQMSASIEVVVLLVWLVIVLSVSVWSAMFRPVLPTLGASSA